MSTKRAVDRRNFIKTAAAGLAGFCLAPSVVAEQPQTTAELKGLSEGKIISRMLGKTGLRLPVVSMGVMNADNPDLVRAALDAGIVHLDTAWFYQNGRNEEMVGEVLQGRSRDSFVIATKVPGSVPLPYATGRFPDDEVSGELLSQAFLKRFDTSLRRLKLDHVDILYLHNVWTREAALFEPLLLILAQLRKEGKTRLVGISTHRNEPEIIQAAVDSQIYDVVLTAYNFRQDHRHQVRQAITQAAQAGLGVVAMKNLAGGYLDKEKQRPVNPKSALRWVLQDENVCTTIPGFTTFEQLEMDLPIMEDITFRESDVKDLGLDSPVEESSKGGFYCQGCERCLKQCPHELPIPDIMRAYLYARSYNNLEAAQDLLLSLNLPPDVCGDCQTCSAICAKGFPISRRILDVVGLLDGPSGPGLV